MNNKLRRAIEQEQRASYDQPHEKIAAQSALLSRALAALGGPVDSERPPEVTVKVPDEGTLQFYATLLAQSLAAQQSVLGLANPDTNEAVITGRNPSMQTDPNRIEMGPEWSSPPQQADGHNEALEGIIVGRDLGDETDTPHTPTEAEMADIGRPEDPSEYCP